MSQLGAKSKTSTQTPPPLPGGSCTPRPQRARKSQNVTFSTYLESEADAREDAEHRGPGGRAVNRQGQVLLKEPETTFSFEQNEGNVVGVTTGCIWNG